MKNIENNFLKDINDAISAWRYSYEQSHVDLYGHRYFQVDVVIEDGNADFDEVWDSLEKVSNDWGAGLDQNFRTFSLALNVSNTKRYG